MTASSTSADMIRGVETLTSTPHASLKSHSLLGWLTRPTVRGTPNSVLASSEVTRLALSSPVEAITTSHRSSRASSSEDSSQESASSHSASGTRSGRIARRALVDEQHLVAVGDQLAGDRATDCSRTGDGDAHRHSSSGPASKAE